jgi:hypothetical protein
MARDQRRRIATRALVVQAPIVSDTGVLTIGYACTNHSASERNSSSFCYSSQFGFSVPSCSETLHGTHDSALAFCERGDGDYRSREQSERVEISPVRIVSDWKVWPEVL